MTPSVGGVDKCEPACQAVDRGALPADTAAVWILLQASERSAELPGGYGAALLQGLVSLGAVCVLAWLLLRFGARRGLGVGQGRRVKVLERVGLDARRSLYLVEVGGKVLLLGAGDGAAPALISELDPAELPALPTEAPLSFGDVLRRLRGGEANESESQSSTPDPSSPDPARDAPAER